MRCGGFHLDEAVTKALPGVMYHELNIRLLYCEFFGTLCWWCYSFRLPNGFVIIISELKLLFQMVLNFCQQSRRRRRRRRRTRRRRRNILWVWNCVIGVTCIVFVLLINFKESLFHLWKYHPSLAAFIERSDINCDAWQFHLLEDMLEYISY